MSDFWHASVNAGLLSTMIRTKGQQQSWSQAMNWDTFKKLKGVKQTAKRGRNIAKSENVCKSTGLLSCVSFFLRLLICSLSSSYWILCSYWVCTVAVRVRVQRILQNPPLIFPRREIRVEQEFLTVALILSYLMLQKKRHYSLSSVPYLSSALQSLPCVCVYT